MINILFLYIVSIISIAFNKSENIITVPLFYHYGTYDMKLYIGDENDFKFVELNLLSDILWLTPPFFENNEILTKAQTENITANNHNITALGINTSIYFDKERTVSIDNYYLYYVDNYIVRGYDSFPLALKFSNQNQSIVHLLYKEKKINSLSFGLKYSIENKTAKLFIGGIPLYELSQFSYQTSLSMNITKTWSSVLDTIHFNDCNYKVNSVVSFLPNNQYILVPMKFLDYLKQKIFQNYFYNKTCVSVIYLDGYGIECEYKFIEYFPSIVFTLQGINFTLTRKELFDYKEGVGIFLIRKKRSSPDLWILGIPFLSHYITKFNYEKNEISFFSSHPFIDEIVYTKDIIGMVKPNLIFLSIIQILFSVMLIICRIRNGI